MDAQRPIGLYDSGIGGLSVVREVLSQLPHESVLYFGDTARVPYGPRSEEEIVAFNREIIAMQLRAGVKLILIACNTSSALALPVIQAECPVPILGLIRPGAEAAVAAGRRVGVIATEGTVRSGAYGRTMRRLQTGVSVQEVACPNLVPLIETGCWEGPEAEAVVREALAPFLAAAPDCLVLGCTHYPHLAPMIARLLPEVTLVNPAARAVAAAAQALADHGMLASGQPTHRFQVSGDPLPFFKLATQLFPGVIEQVEQVQPPLSAAVTP